MNQHIQFESKDIPSNVQLFQNMVSEMLIREEATVQYQRRRPPFLSMGYMPTIHEDAVWEEPAVLRKRIWTNILSDLD